MRSYGARRDDNEPAIIAVLMAAGAKVKQISQPGVADLLVEYRRRIHLLEVKDPAKPPSARALSAPQRDFHRDFRVSVVLTPVDALKAVGSDWFGIAWVGKGKKATPMVVEPRLDTAPELEQVDLGSHPGTP